MTARCVVLGLVLLAAIATTATAAAGDAVFKGVHLSDLHVDPFFGTPLAQSSACRNASAPWYGLPWCDSSYTMMASALDDITATLAATNASVLYFTGDWLRHDMGSLKKPNDVALEVFERIAAALANMTAKVVAHPAIPVSLGNEDFIPDYHLNVSSVTGEPVNEAQTALLKGMAGILAKHNLLNATQAQTFSYCGYTSQPLVVGSLAIRVITLNTLLYSKKLTPETKAADPCGQFAWLKKELESAKAAGEVVHILSHIFPDIKLWKPEHVDTYKALLEKHSDVLQAQFYGHIHRMSYIAQQPGFLGAPRMPTIHVGGPITRASATNPDFAVITFDAETGGVVDREQRFFNDSTLTWQTGASLRDILRITSLEDSTNLLSATTRLMNTSDATANNDFQLFWKLFNGGAVTTPCTGLCQKVIMCSTVSLDVLDVLAECKILEANPEARALRAALVLPLSNE